MTVVFCMGVNCDDVYRLVIARFEVLRYATTILSAIRGKSLAEEQNCKISYFTNCGLTERQISL